MNDPATITLDEIDRGIILGALRSMASCLVQHGHTWDEGKRAAYEQANDLLKGERLEWTDATPPEDDADKWKQGG